jgi:hypothetical protein
MLENFDKSLEVCCAVRLLSHLSGVGDRDHDDRCAPIEWAGIHTEAFPTVFVPL